MEVRLRLIGKMSKLNETDHRGRVLIFHAPQKSPTSALEIENNVDLFFFRLPRHCSSSVRSSEPDGQSGSLSASSESCVGCVTKKTTGNVECKNVAPPSRQCTSAHSVVDSRNVSKAFYSCPSTIFIFA